MMQNKILFGITGGTGCGKSTVSDMIRSMGYEVIDCDKVSRMVTEADSPCLKELKSEFGDCIIDKDGTLKRKVLGDMVFSDSHKLKRLNEITHKHIVHMIFCMAENSPSPLVGVDGAVLFESGITDKLQKIIGVLSERQKRVERIVKRDSMTEEDAIKRINSQKSDKFFIENCHYLLYNNGSEEQLKVQVKEVVQKLELLIKSTNEENGTNSETV